MNKLLYFILIIVSLFGCKKADESSGSTTTSSAAPQVTKNELPPFQFRLVDGNPVDFRSVKGKTVLVLFQADCDHCQHEAEDIRQNLERFKDQHMYFVSSSPVEQIVKFSKDYGLSEKANISFGSTTNENILNVFGPISAPSIYIYSEGGRLVKTFNGQTPVGEILKYL